MTQILREIKAKRYLSVKLQLLVAGFAVVAAVALPQLFHLIGALTGTGTMLGIALLPMHLPIILAGLMAGPVAGALAGAMAPVISFALTGMPLAANLPLMVAELAVYGLVAGLFKKSSLPSIVKILVAQVAGRAVYLAAVMLAVYAAGRSDLGVLSALESFKAGVFGLLFQWTLLPLLLYRIEHATEDGE